MPGGGEQHLFGPATGPQKVERPERVEPEMAAVGTLWTVGHGTQTAGELGDLLTRSGVRSVVDVRRAPGSRRHPLFRRTELETWMPAAGITYRWEADLGGFRRPAADSPNVALRHPSFRAYADHMATEPFAGALQRVLEEARQEATAVMCSETLWWRCHRRLIADAATVLHGFAVRHLDRDGRSSPHRLTEGVRRLGSILRYDQGI